MPSALDAQSAKDTMVQDAKKAAPAVEGAHPLHPATVHLPIAFLLTHSVLEPLAYIGRTSPSILRPLASYFTSSSTIALTSHLSHLSHISLCAGLITSLPALSSGIWELYKMTNGFKTLTVAEVTKEENGKLRTALWHAALNDMAVGAGVYNWWTKRAIEGYVGGGRQAVAAAAIFATSGIAAGLGGELVYGLGMGVQQKTKKEKGL